MIFSFDIAVQQLIKGILYEGGVFIGSILFGAGIVIGVYAMLKALKIKSLNITKQD
jgi:hypothetical protein